MKYDRRILAALVLQILGFVLGLLWAREQEERLLDYAFNPDRDYITLPSELELLLLLFAVASFLVAIALTAFALIGTKKKAE